MSHAISDIGHAVSGAVHGIENAITNPAQLLGTTLGFGIGGAGGLMGGTAAGNVATGQPLGQGLQQAGMGDLAGLGLGTGLSGFMGAGGAGQAGADFGGFTVDPATGDVIPAGGGGMGGFTVDPATGDVIPSGGGGAGSPFGGYTVDPNTGDVIPSGGGAGGAAGGAAGGGGLSAGNILSGAGAASRLLGGGGQGGFMNFLTGQGGGPSLPGLAPGLAALAYARNQPGLDTSKLSDTYNAAAANAPLFTQAAIDPLKQAQAGGYGDILQSQANRGIRGSSFGDQSIANYLTDTNRGIADAGASAANQALGLQGNLAGNLALLQNQAQQQKNQLYGRAFDMLGRGLQGGGPGMPSMGGAGGLAPGMGNVAGGSNSFLGNLGLGGVGNAFGNVLGNIGSGLGNLFGSPGSTFWGTGGGPSFPAPIPMMTAGGDTLGSGLSLAGIMSANPGQQAPQLLYNPNNQNQNLPMWGAQPNMMGAL